MPTHPDVLTELAVRYGKCDAGSAAAIDRFYTDQFSKLPRTTRDRIGFEVLIRDGEPTGRTLTREEIAELDEIFLR